MCFEQEIPTVFRCANHGVQMVGGGGDSLCTVQFFPSFFVSHQWQPGSLSSSHDWLLFADGTASQSESIQVVSVCIGWLLLVSICTDIEDQDSLGDVSGH